MIMTSFIDMNLQDNIIEALKRNNIVMPTDIQLRTMDEFKNESDILAGSGTGTGKTLAYLLPIISHLKENSDLQAIVLAPSQELSVQINTVFNNLAKEAGLNLKSISLLSDANIKRQIEALKEKPQLIIGMPNRILELINMKKIKVHNVNFMVLDEADKLLEKRNLGDVLQLRKCLLKYTKILFFSASIENCSLDSIEKICFNKISKINIVSDRKNVIPDTINHVYILSSRKEKSENLRRLLSVLNEKKVIVFFNDKFVLKDIFEKLKHHKYNVSMLSGETQKSDRRIVLNQFKQKSKGILLTTDISARGLDIENVYCVINFALPEETKEYLHRSGRCGRNKNKGLCISILTENEQLKLKKIASKYNIGLNQILLANGEIITIDK